MKRLGRFLARLAASIRGELTVRGPLPRPIWCPVCRKQFATSVEYTAHRCPVM